MIVSHIHAVITYDIETLLVTFYESKPIYINMKTHVSITVWYPYFKIHVKGNLSI